MGYVANEQTLVLVIDDEQQVLDDVAAILARANLSCRGCRNSHEAFEVAESTQFALILCDVSLQGESAVDVCEQLRQRPGMQDVPVMFLSGAQLPDIVRRRYPAGGIYCLRKPFDATVLLQLIDQALAVPQT